MYPIGGVAFFNFDLIDELYNRKSLNPIGCNPADFLEYHPIKFRIHRCDNKGVISIKYFVLSPHYWTT